MQIKTILLTVAATLALTGAPAFAQDTDAPTSLPLDELQLFSEIFGRIKSEYVDATDDGELLHGAIRGMLTDLDPHSAFLDANAYREMQRESEEHFSGLGIEVAIEDGQIKVIAPIDDTPAMRAGLMPGDIIIMLDGESVHGVGLNEAVARMRGPAGSEVTLSIARPGLRDPFDVELVRAVIKISGVKSEMLEENFGYVRIANFRARTGADLRDAVRRLMKENKAALHGLVLDLRNNPGGALHAAVEVGDAFLRDGIITSTRGRGFDSDQTFRATSNDILRDAPVVVLVNRGSASASEIVAGALQDRKRALILGTRTFGKGSVQTVIPMDGGGALKLTTARYYTPANRSIQTSGIEPDIVVENDPPQAGETERGFGEGDLNGDLRDEDDADLAAPAGSGLAARDHHVGEALKLLKGMSLVRQQAGGGEAGEG